MTRRLALLFAVFAVVSAACSSTVFSLEVGDCFDDPASFTQVDNVEVVDCADPHDNEVYAVVEYTESNDWPGNEAIEFAAFTECLDAFEPFIGVAYEVSKWDIAAFWPSEESWNDANDREIICAVYDLSGAKVTGTARGSAE